MNPDTTSLGLSQRARRRAPSPIRELMPYLGIEDMISLGGGYPNPLTFPFEEISLRARGGETLSLTGAQLLQASQYGPTEGLSPLLEEIRGWQRYKDGVEIPEAGLLMLNGSQEGLYILADLLLDEGDEVVLSEPSYPGAAAAFRSFSDRFLAIPLDEEGMRCDLLGRVLAERRARGQGLPRLVYTVPNGHNPAGVSLSERRRRELVELACKYDLLLLEDDPYQLLRFAGSSRPPTLQSLLPERVLRLDSFSKILCPGLRLGYASGPPWLIRAMVLHKQASNLQTASLAQALLLMLLRFLGHEGLMQSIADKVALYLSNRDTMVRAAQRHLPEELSFDIPQAGMFIWFELPDGYDASRMIDLDCTELGVLLVPGPAFSTQGGCCNAMRASFSMVPKERIEEGIRRFARMLEREKERVEGGTP